MFHSLFKKTEESPEWLQKYDALNFTYPKDTLINEIPFCVFDCETTGLEKNSEIISLGAVKFQNRSIKVDDVIHIKFSVEKGQKQSEIHEELVFDQILNQESQTQTIVEYIGNSVLVGHHVAFDIKMLNGLVSKFKKPFSLKNKSIDTFDLMKRIDPVRIERNIGSYKNMKLEALCKEFEIPIENRHTALGDAFMTAQLFSKQLIHLKKRKVEVFKDLKVN